MEEENLNCVNYCLLVTLCPMILPSSQGCSIGDNRRPLPLGKLYSGRHCAEIDTSLHSLVLPSHTQPRGVCSGSGGCKKNTCIYLFIYLFILACFPMLFRTHPPCLLKLRGSVSLTQSLPTAFSLTRTLSLSLCPSLVGFPCCPASHPIMRRLNP